MSPLPKGARGIEPLGTLTQYPPKQSLRPSIMKRSHSLTRSELFLAYDRKLVQRAKEMRKNPTPAEKKLWDDYLPIPPFPTPSYASVRSINSLSISSVLHYAS